MISCSSRSGGRRGIPAIGAALATGTVLVTVLAGCGSSSPGAGKGPAAQAPLSPVKAISLAAAQRVNSLSALISIRTGSLTGPVSATMNARLRPTLFIDMTLKGLSVGGSAPANIEEILTNKALYLKDSALAKVARLGHKSWIEITFAQLSSKSGVNFSSLLQNMENSNPENQVKLFAASKNIHVVGSQTINGVPTTEYAGSYLPSVALGKVPASLRKLMGPAMRLMGNKPVTFHVWIDAQHLTRKAIVDETIAGHSVVTSYVITSVNQPISVTLPPPSQVASMP